MHQMINMAVQMVPHFPNFRGYKSAVIFSDDKLIHECYLEKPLILEVIEKLSKSGKINFHETIPKNKQELFGIINSKD